MIKLSFYNTPYLKSTKISHPNNQATLVSITGKVRVFMGDIVFPPSIFKWAKQYAGVSVKDQSSHLTVTAIGKTIRNPEDTDCPVYAERIADARAKIKLYRFMYNLCIELFDHLAQKTVGSGNAPCRYSSNSIYGDIKKYENLLQKEKDHLDNLLKL